MRESYLKAAAEVTEQVLREAYEPTTFNDMIKRSARATVAALGTYVTRATRGKDATAELELIKRCVQLLEDLNVCKHNDFFTLEAYKPHPQTKEMKQAQDAYVAKRKAQLERQQQLVVEQLARETNSTEFGAPLEAFDDGNIVSREQLTERSRKRFSGGKN